MFLMVLVFSVVLVLTFGIVLVMTRPTSIERTIAGRIRKLQAALKAAPAPEEQGPEIVKQTRLSANARLDALLQQWKLMHKLHLLIAQAESAWSVAGVLACSAALGLIGYALGLYELPNPLLALAPALGLAASPVLVLRYQRSRRLREFNRHLADSIDLMSRALRAGHSLTAAIEIVGDESPEPVRSEFRSVYQQQNFGLPAREALVQLAQRIPLPELNFVVTAILLQKETGGNLVEVLDRTTAVIRERLRIQGEVRIYTAQGRMTGWILSVLPIAMFFLLSLANRGYTRVLVEDPTGRKLVYTGVGLMLLGGLAIRKIVNVKI
ncbi:MAG TPA: type II secretion system F family protein [Candidatus Binatia bacterium]|nr:type II secretion system F family protein [Candidatus Binatia bacterium]